MTGLSLPRFGMGCAPIGNLYAAVGDAEAEATIMAALDAGIRYFDTAPYYGFGLAERRLGSALPADTIVSTKVGRLLDPADNPAPERHGFVAGDPFEPRFDYSYDAVIRSHEQSLARLNRDRIDILLAHDLGEVTHGGEADRHMRAFLDGGYRALTVLKEGGAIDAIGIGVNECAVAEYLVERIDLDVILIAGRYTLLDRSAAERLLPLCAARNVKLIVGGPYNSGILAQPARARLRATYNYEAASSDVIERAEAIERICDRFGVPLPAAALQFPFRESAVGCVIAGLASPAEVNDACERLATPIPDALWLALDQEGLVRPTAEHAR